MVQYRFLIQLYMVFTIFIAATCFAKAKQSSCIGFFGKWRVSSVLESSSGAEADPSEGKPWRNKILTVSNKSIRFIKENCRDPKFSEKLVSLNDFFDKFTGSAPEDFGIKGAAAAKYKACEIACAKGNLGPAAAGNSQLILLSKNKLGMTYYDGFFLELQKN